MKNEVRSPITNSLNTIKIKDISINQLVNDYKIILPEIEVEKYFGGKSTIELYECKDTNYRFYYPFNLDGDDEFYVHLGKLSWYYLRWKWEHQFALECINKGSKVLEVGAGKGDFIRELIEKLNCKCTGLELNPDIKDICDKYGVDLRNETIQNHALNNLNVYDTICTFQVLEHVSDVSGFIKGMVDCLKPKGTLIIAVPNNDTFIKDNPLPSKALNMPPHHVGLWTETSLSKIASCFGLELVAIDFEPLQQSNMDTYICCRYSKTIRKICSTFNVEIKYP